MLEETGPAQYEEEYDGSKLWRWSGIIAAAKMGVSDSSICSLHDYLSQFMLF